MTVKTTLCRGASLAVLLSLCAVGVSHAQYAPAQDAPPPQDQMAAPRPTMSPDEMQAKIEELEDELQFVKQVQAEQTGTINNTVQQVAHPDKLGYKGVSITLGGFLEAASIYRDHNENSDISSSFAAIPFKGPAGPGSPSNAASVGHTEEFKESARQSRLSALVQGDVNPVTHLAAYMELDFQGAAHTANYNESNSFNIRWRHVYGTLDRDDYGLHFLGGQTWSLATLNTKGITPRNELTPPQIDAQYVPGFVWARQAQFRITKDLLDKKLWLAVSFENPQTTFGAVNVLPTVRTVYNVAGGGVLDSTNNFSLNHVPDVIGKIAYEGSFMDRTFHAEALAMYRDFYDRYSTNNGGSYSNQDVNGYGVGGSVVLTAYPKLLDLQASVLYGQGIGRYGSSQLPDVTFRPDGKIEPIQEFMFLAGGTAHYGKDVDVYVFGGAEAETKRPYTVAGAAYGVGNGLTRSDGCFSEAATTGCSVNTKLVDQATVGFWWRFYQGSFGRAQLGAQYSYTERVGFTGSNATGAPAGSPTGTENMVFTSIRYYPF